MWRLNDHGSDIAAKERRKRRVLTWKLGLKSIPFSSALLDPCCCSYLFNFFPENWEIVDVGEWIWHYKPLEIIFMHMWVSICWHSTRISQCSYCKCSIIMNREAGGVTRALEPWITGCSTLLHHGPRSLQSAPFVLQKLRREMISQQC